MCISNGEIAEMRISSNLFCLEDSTTRYVIAHIMNYELNILARLWLARRVQNQSRITPDATDLFFHGFFYLIKFIFGFLCAFTAL